MFFSKVCEQIYKGVRKGDEEIKRIRGYFYKKMVLLLIS